MMAATGPIDRIAENRPAMTISGKARSNSMKRFVSRRSGCQFGDRLRAAKKLSGTSEDEGDDGRDERDIDRDDHQLEIFGDVEIAPDIDAAIGEIEFFAADTVVVGARQCRKARARRRPSPWG